MSKVIDYYYAMPSPWAYLGAARFTKMAEAANAAVTYKPCDFGRVFSRTGVLMLKDRAPARQAYRLVELKRWSRYLDVQLTVEPKFFPVSDELAARFVIAAGQQGIAMGPLTFAIMRAVWAEERDISDADTLRALAESQGLAGAALLTAAREPATLEAYERNSDEAVARGVFGAPTYIYRDELFWGQDRLDFLQRALGI
jgi:2-hydroxychromene-2-carboxylate isomerase